MSTRILESENASCYAESMLKGFKESPKYSDRLKRLMYSNHSLSVCVRELQNLDLRRLENIDDVKRIAECIGEIVTFNAEMIVSLHDCVLDDERQAERRAS